MFKPSRIHHSSCAGHCALHVPETFSLLCWNVYKNNKMNPHFDYFLEKEVQKRALFFMLFQEASFHYEDVFNFQDFSYDAAANLEFRKHFYGVMTVSRAASKEVKAYLTKGKESIFGTHKSILLTTYLFEDGSTLLMLNMHAINFRENRRYSKEMDRLMTLIEAHDGPMILAGDFNTWSHMRLMKLQEIAEKLSLIRVGFEKTGKIKSFMGKQLDFIFYRGFEVLEEEVLNDHKLSDHHPLFVKFKKI
ncbi:MAG TPA: endonuclease/exonuclease/phosphatase family protein [Sulfurovum sp.]|nr:endonuclease/exonuclease/phosphatase family protein [Sulfurovum sp.]